MKHKLVIGIAVAAALVIVLPCFAQEADGAGRGACGIEGTWYGANTAGLNLIFRIEKNAGGGYSAVADGFSDPDLLVYCLDFTAWHGEVAKTGPNTYSFRQIELCDPNPDIFGPIPGLLLWATEGELTVVDCDRMEGDMPAVGAYFWGSGKVPFVDPFDIPFPDPVFGVFERMPGL